MFYPCPVTLRIYYPQAHRISFLLCAVLAPIPNNSKQRVRRVIVAYLYWALTELAQNQPPLVSLAFLHFSPNHDHPPSAIPD